MTSEWDVDVIIAVHKEERPVEKAVASVLDRNNSRIRVTIVAHNLPGKTFSERLKPWIQQGNLRIAELVDGSRSPAGPFNLGLHLAEAEFTAVLGSDDEHQPGAIDSWLKTQRKTGASAVIPQLLVGNYGPLSSPPVRPFRRRGLHPLKDRLAFRSTQLGLVSRQAFGDLRFAEGLSTGEDIAYTLQIWFSGAKISFDTNGPGYLTNSEDLVSASRSRKSVAEELSFLAMLEEPWFTTLDSRSQNAIVHKVITTNVLQTVLTRLDQPDLSQELDTFRQTITRYRLHKYPAINLLSRNHAQLLRATLQPDPAESLDVMTKLKSRIENKFHIGNLVTDALSLSFHRIAPVRRLCASMVLMAQYK